MTVETFTFLQVNPLFNKRVDFGYIATAETYWKAKLTQYAD